MKTFGVWIVALLATVIALMMSDLCTAEIRWCANGNVSDDITLSENATRYNDESYACMECPTEAKLVSLNELEKYECCGGRIAPVGVCPGKDLLHLCGAQAKCDGKKQCRDGRDEMGCYGCLNGSFGCDDATLGPQCLPKSKLCDSVKDCTHGEDEALCPYYGGWCDGYLCGGDHPKCLNYSQICDGAKNCMDGSDESDCQYCPNQFRCRVYFKQEIDTTTAECVGRFRVCDGVRDCINGADETHCYRWLAWSTWSECGTITEPCTRIRRRSCMNGAEVVVSSTLCYDNDSDFDENHIDICPECLLEPTSTTTAPTSTSGNDSSPLPQKEDSGIIPFDTGALVGTVVGGSLALIGSVFGIGVCLSYLNGRTGFWRPPTKLPRTSNSILPGIGNPGRNGMRLGEASHPYPINDKPKVTADLEASSSFRDPGTSLRSVSGNALDSGINEGVGVLRNIGRNLVPSAF